MAHKWSTGLWTSALEAKLVRKGFHPWSRERHTPKVSHRGNNFINTYKILALSTSRGNLLFTECTLRDEPFAVYFQREYTFLPGRASTEETPSRGMARVRTSVSPLDPSPSTNKKDPSRLQFQHVERSPPIYFVHVFFDCKQQHRLI